MKNCKKSIFALIIVVFLLLGLFSGIVTAEEKEKVIIVSPVWAENNMTGAGMGTGRNLLEELSLKHNIEVEFHLSTGSMQEVQEILFRIGSLPKTEEDMFYVLQSFADERIINFLTPLDKYLKEKPLEGFPEEYSEDMLNIYRKNGSLYAIPIRGGVWNLWYNKRIFEERGIKEPPRTPEEIYEIAKQCTYTKENGEKVYGFAPRGVRWSLHEQLAIGARMFGGDLITPDYKITINQPPVIKVLELYQKMYQEGIMPPNWNSLASSDSDQYLREGRAAMSLASANYNWRYNDPKVSKEAGNIVPDLIPLAKNLWSDEKTFSDSISFTWAIAILKGSTQKDTAWDVIRYLTLKDSSIEMAKNENAPVMISVLRWQAEEDPGAQIATKVFKYARSALPALENSNQIIDLIGEHMENVILLGKSAQAEMDLAAKEIEKLMK